MKKAIILVVILILVFLGFYFLSEDKGAETNTSTQTVNLFYYNPELDTGEDGNILCSDQGLVSVKREIKESEDIVSDTIQMLIQGDITEEEKSKGIETDFPLDGFSLVNSTLEDGELTLVFNDPDFRSSGGSCRVSILLNQIVRTAEQFTEVEAVRITPEDIFQP